MKEITKIHPLSVAKINAVLFPICGIIAMMVMYLAYVAMYFTTLHPVSPDGVGQGAQDLNPMYALDYGKIFLLVILFSLSGYFLGYVGAFVYNILAPKIGGIKISLKE